MLRLNKIAVTGGIASGKSTVCLFFKELGAYVVSADEIVHQLLLSTETPLGQKIIKLIGPDIIVHGQIDRSKVAKKVFNQPELLKALESLLHPAVYEEIKKQYHKVSQDQLFPLFIAEVPLLFESAGESFFDYTIAVIADEKRCSQRFQNALGYDEKEYDRRAARQMQQLEKKQRADFTIENNGSLTDLKMSVNDLFKKLTK